MLPSGASTAYALQESEQAYLVAAAGSIDVNGEVLAPGDGAAIHGERRLQIRAIEDAEVVLVVAAGRSRNERRQDQRAR